MSKKQRVADWLAGKERGPYKLQLNPTNRCNLACKFCWLRDFENIDYGQEVSDRRILELVPEAAEAGVQEIEITGGGEPLMRKGLVLSLMHKIKQEERRGNLTTNGTLIDQTASNSLLDLH